MPAIEVCYPRQRLSYLDAARVCLDRHHTPPQEFTLKDDGNESLALVDWKITSERDKNAWANQDDAKGVTTNLYAASSDASSLGLSSKTLMPASNTSNPSSVNLPSFPEILPAYFG